MANDPGTAGEEFIASICSSFYLEDFVYPNPKYEKGGIQKELCDVLIFYDKIAIPIEIKTANQIRKHDPFGEKVDKWIHEQYKKATRQVKGAIRRISRGGTLRLENRVHGEVIIEPGSVEKMYGIAIVDHPPRGVYGGPQVVYSDTNEYQVITCNFQEFTDIIRELGTVADLVDYFSLRERLSGRIVYSGNDERDLIAAYAMRLDSLYLPDDELPDSIYIEPNLWDDFITGSKKKDRDEYLNSEWVVSGIIGEIKKARAHPDSGVDYQHIDSEDTPVSSDRIALTTELSRLDRHQKAEIGRSVLKKSEKYNGSRPRYFSVQYENRMPLLFVVSNKDREKRYIEARSLAVMALAAYETEEIFVVAMNAVGHEEMSFDYMIVVASEDRSAEEHRQICEDAKIYFPNVDRKSKNVWDSTDEYIKTKTDDKDALQN